MAEARASSRDLELLSARAHTPESFGRAIVSASLAAAAADAEAIQRGGAIKISVNVTVTPIPQIGAWVCVGIEGFGTFCRLERQD
jgi:hypothetical protein